MVEALQPFLVRLRVLAQVTPGDIISVNDSGQWATQPASQLSSAWRAFIGIITRRNTPSQRDVFLAAARETVHIVDEWVSLTLRGAAFRKGIDKNTGALSREVISRLGHEDGEEIEKTLQALQTVAGCVQGALFGLRVLKSHPPYCTDGTFCSLLDISVVEFLERFLQSVRRRVGPEFAGRVFADVPAPAAPAPRFSWAHGPPPAPAPAAPAAPAHVAAAPAPVAPPPPAAASGPQAPPTPAARAAAVGPPALARPPSAANLAASGTLAPRRPSHDPY